MVRRIPVDMVVLMTGAGAADGRRPSRQRHLTLSRSRDGFFLEQHPKLAPVATPTDGIFIAGTCQGPKDIPDTVAQASAAAAGRARPLGAWRGRGSSRSPARSSRSECAGCRVCNTLCPFAAITLRRRASEVSAINDAICKGCGTCAAACPSGAIRARHFTDRQILDEIVGVMRMSFEPKIVGILCNWCSYAGADLAGTARDHLRAQPARRAGHVLGPRRPVARPQGARGGRRRRAHRRLPPRRLPLPVVLKRRLAEAD